jgi:hypothetical protein
MRHLQRRPRPGHWLQLAAGCAQPHVCGACEARGCVIMSGLGRVADVSVVVCRRRLRSSVPGSASGKFFWQNCATVAMIHEGHNHG